MTKYQIILMIIILNTLIAIGYMIFMGKKKQLKKGVLVGSIMIIAPIYGILLFLLSYFCFLILKKTKAAFINPEELSFSKAKIKSILGDDLQRGINKVPIEEALLESDHESTRQVLLDVLKSDYESSIPILMKAIENEDSEVSHYASAAISDVLSRFKRNQKEIDEQYRKYSEDEEILTNYRNYVFKYLSYQIFPEVECNSYLNLYEELMQQSYRLFPKKIEEKDYEDWICLLVKCDRQDVAKKWLDIMEKEYPDQLSTYKAQLQFSYRYNKKEFKEVLQKIKSSQVMLDEKTIEIVRFFQEM